MKTGKLILWGIAGVVGYSLLKNRASAQEGSSGGVILSGRLKPVYIKKDEPVTAASYRVIKNRRDGMFYTQAGGRPGSEISFSSPQAGYFTRNVVVEGAQILAEVKS